LLDGLIATRLNLVFNVYVLIPLVFGLLLLVAEFFLAVLVLHLNFLGHGLLLVLALVLLRLCLLTLDFIDLMHLSEIVFKIHVGYHLILPVHHLILPRYLACSPLSCGSNISKMVNFTCLRSIQLLRDALQLLVYMEILLGLHGQTGSGAPLTFLG